MSELHDLCLSNTEFGVDLYKKLSESDPNSNIFFSPMSISLALAMTSLGAKGKTETEMKTVLKLDKISKDVHPLYKLLINQLQASGNNYKLFTANKLYGEKSNSFMETFLKNCKEYYGAGLEPVDFKHKTKECESLINNWVEKQTNHKIKNLIASGSLDAFTELVLVNAIYFKSSWENPFAETNTKEEDFFVTKDKIVKVPLMHFYKKKFSYRFHVGLDSQILEIPYVNHKLSFVVILPDLKKTSLSEVEKKMTGLTMQDVMKECQHVDVNLWLPKFKLESTPEIKEKLKQLGMFDLFIFGQADLSNINGAKNLYVSAIIHKAFIDVNEQGTEAAAATAVVVRLGCGPSPRTDPVDFRADHPFIFTIKDNSSGAVLFMGKFMKP